MPVPSQEKSCAGICPHPRIWRIHRMQRETSDAVSRLLRKGNVSFSGLADIRMSFRRLEVGSSLNVEELLRVAKLLETTSRVKAWSRSAQASLEEQNKEALLEEMFTSLQPLTSLAMRSTAAFRPKKRSQTMQVRGSSRCAVRCIRQMTAHPCTVERHGQRRHKKLSAGRRDHTAQRPLLLSRSRRNTAHRYPE